jgi:hypothetical protein
MEEGKFSFKMLLSVIISVVIIYIGFSVYTAVNNQKLIKECKMDIFSYDQNYSSSDDNEMNEMIEKINYDTKKLWSQIIIIIFDLLAGIMLSCICFLPDKIYEFIVKHAEIMYLKSEWYQRIVNYSRIIAIVVLFYNIYKIFLSLGTATLALNHK